MYSSYVFSIHMIFCASLLASEVTMGQKAQSLKEVRVSMDFEDKKIIDAFNSIQKETGFTFVYLKNEKDQKLKLKLNCLAAWQSAPKQQSKRPIAHHQAPQQRGLQPRRITH